MLKSEKEAVIKDLKDRFTRAKSAVLAEFKKLDVETVTKLRKKFRNYGANIVVIGHDGASLPASALAETESALGGRGIAVRFAYVVARTPDGGHQIAMR